MQEMIRQILTSKVYEAAIETPLEEAVNLSRELKNRILLKREDLQPVFSFKLRGAYNKIAHLSDAEKNKGVITASAGNHAQGVAFSAQKLGLKTLIVMPATTPQIKIDAVKAFDAKIVLHGDSYSEAAARCNELLIETGMTYIHPFDDKLVIAGQATIADELLRQSAGKLDAVFVPIGGGGLISGIGAYFKALLPDIKIIGVEPLDSDAMYQSLQAGKRITLKSVGIFADGVAVRDVGDLTFNDGPLRKRLFQRCPRVFRELLDTEADIVMLGINLGDHAFNFFTFSEDGTGMLVFLCPGQIVHVEEAVNALFQLDEGAGIGEFLDGSGETHTFGIALCNGTPRIREDLLESEGNTSGRDIVVEDLGLHFVSDVQQFFRV